MTRILLAAATAVSLGAASPAMAQALAHPPAWAAPGLIAAQDEVLTEPEMREALAMQGYSDIRVLQADGDMYEMSAQKNGKAVLLRANARSRRYSERPAD